MRNLVPLHWDSNGVELSTINNGIAIVYRCGYTKSSLLITVNTAFPMDGLRLVVPEAESRTGKRVTR